MLDMQKQRLSQLVCTVIADLWKKESGSVSSVCIEGTICITSGTGAITTLQLKNRFAGTIPDSRDESKHFENDNISSDLVSNEKVEKPRTKRKLDLTRVTNDSKIYNYNDKKFPIGRNSYSNPAAVQAYLDELSPASLVSPTSDVSPGIKSLPLLKKSDNDVDEDHNSSVTHNRSLTRYQSGFLHKSNGMDSGIGGDDMEEMPEVNDEPSSMDFSINRLKDDFLSEEEDNLDVEDEKDILNISTNSSVAGPVCPGTGYYTSFAEDRNHSNSPIISKPKTFHTDLANNNNIDKDLKLVDHQSDNDNRTMVIGDFSTGDGPGPMMSTPKVNKSPPRLCPQSPTNLSHSFNDSHSHSESVLDLTKARESVDDLKLSAPQNYTAQVRDVIRQRLMAHRGDACEDGSLVTAAKDAKEAHSNDSRDETLNFANSNATISSSALAALQHLPHLKSAQPALSLGGSHNLSVTNHLIPSPTALFPTTFPYPLHQMSLSYKNALMPYGMIAAQMARQHHSHSRLLPPSAASIESQSHSLDKKVLSSSSTEQPINLATQDSFLADGNSTASTSSDHLNKSLVDSKDGGSNEITQKIYKCDFCSKSFLFKSKYHEHLPVHTNARPFQCRLCSRTYKYKYDLRVHLRTHMGIPTKSTICPFCNAKFDTNKLLRIHIRDAHKERHRVTEDECTQMYEGVL